MHSEDPQVREWHFVQYPLFVPLPGIITKCPPQWQHIWVLATCFPSIMIPPSSRISDLLSSIQNKDPN